MCVCEFSLPNYIMLKLRAFLAVLLLCMELSEQCKETGNKAYVSVGLCSCFMFHPIHNYVAKKPSIPHRGSVFVNGQTFFA